MGQVKVLAADVGSMTGIAMGDGVREPEACALPLQEALDYCQILMDQSRPDFVIVEAFVITTATAKKSQHGKDSIEGNGVLRFLARRYGIAFDDSQTPSTAKNFITDEKLRRVGWWDKSDHARDAMRHLLTYLVTHHAFDAHRLLPPD